MGRLPLAGQIFTTWKNVSACNLHEGKPIENATPGWQILEATLPTDAVATAEALLELAGAHSIALVDAGGEVLLEPPPGAAPLWTSVRLRAVFPAAVDLQPMTGVLANLSDQRPVLQTIDEQDWAMLAAERQVEHRFGRRLWVVPHPGDHGRDRVEVIMSPGLAFGSGDHPTTAMCLEWLDSHLTADSRLLDYGCGSGILGIAALKLGAAQVAAVDVEEQAITATWENAKRNKVAERLSVGMPETVHGTTFDIAMANILAGPLTALAKDLTRLVCPGGTLVLSGLLAAQGPQIKRAYGSDFGSWREMSRSGWLLLWSRRRG